MDSEAEKLDFSYRYPFSKTAIGVISSAPSRIEERYLKLGRIRLEEDLHKKAPIFEEVRLEEIKRAIVISYVYSRMLASALNDRYLLNLYINAESNRAKSILSSEKMQNLLRLSEELGIPILHEGDAFAMRFEDFLMNKRKGSAQSLVNANLHKGKVYLSAAELSEIIAESARKRIAANLPISAKNMPKEIIEYAKGVKRPVRKVRAASGGKVYRWIEKILATPIHDVRHRTVNLILAPYLINVRNMPESDAAKIISEYIERCKELNPDTNVNQAYINYQCRYAKEKGMKPLSLKRAKELYAGTIEIGE
jgi:hypothetical protein